MKCNRVNYDFICSYNPNKKQNDWGNHVHIVILHASYYDLIIPPATEGEGGVYWFEPVRPSGRPSVDTCYRNNS